MQEVVPWVALTELIKPHYHVAGKVGRPPKALLMMTKIYLIQQWFNLSDPAMEEAISDSTSIRHFVGIDLGNEGAPDETTIMNFRHLLEIHNLAMKILDTINGYLADNGIRISTGSIVDATIIAAPTSTKNRDRQRDPDMKSTKKAGQWYFGMKGHIGVDGKTKIFHSVEYTAANTHDSQVMEKLLHGKEKRVYGDSAYVGQKERMVSKAPQAKDFTQKKGFRNRKLTEKERQSNRYKSKTRAKGEHPFHIIKRVFGYAKTRYRGLFKNGFRFIVNMALSNLYIHRHRLA